MENTCSICQRPKAHLGCGICNSTICKKCAQFLDEDSFSFLPKVPAELTHTIYCYPCFGKIVDPQQEIYNQTMERAKQVQVYFIDQGKETRLLKRLEETIQVLDCTDRDETIMRLAFLAANLNFDGIIDVDVRSEKVRNGGYQTLKWKGSAIPTYIDPKRVIRSRAF